MNKKWLAVYLVIFLMLVPLKNVLAVCPSDSLSKLKTYASNINYDYHYTETNNGVIFQVRFTNVHPNLYIYDVENNKNYYTDKNQEIRIENLLPGKQYKFVVKSSDSASSSNKQEVTVIIDGKESTIIYDSGENEVECQNIEISNKYINLPNYNSYYKDPLCKGMENYQICSKWNQNKLTYEQFKQEIERLKLEEKQEEKKETKVEEKTVLELITEYVRKNYIVIMIASIVIIGIGVIIYKKTKEDNFNGW